VNGTLEDWFRREILPHEPTLVRFLSRRRPNHGDVEDLRHDIYVRVLEAAEHARPVSAKAFLFSTARNLLIDRARRDRIVAIDFLDDIDLLDVLIDDVSPERQTSGRQQLQRLAKVFDRLPPRCRDVLWMRRIDGLTQKQVAERLGIAEGTVERHLFRSLRMLADGLLSRAHQREETADAGSTHSGQRRGP
jgi:RNA polymerase sigma factor (sigma-70 family)